MLETSGRCSFWLVQRTAAVAMNNRDCGRVLDAVTDMFPRKFYISMMKTFSCLCTMHLQLAMSSPGESATWQERCLVQSDDVETTNRSYVMRSGTAHNIKFHGVFLLWMPIYLQAASDIDRLRPAIAQRSEDHVKVFEKIIDTEPPLWK
ncbi:hypothetical protein POM88_003084 [Heracleum sosnowskyi]|uniref:Uncharacterized protein n=1 Tax=Heracleum sosnowskyi TaxID=360622 RepID=A0AAD8JFV3_9APIA|nr:hypothetical protein POM88_003084 [Heracleum sosnowskyi]